MLVDALLSGVRRARRAQSAVALPGRYPGAGRGFARRCVPQPRERAGRRGTAQIRAPACWSSCRTRPRAFRPRRSKRSCNARSSTSAAPAASEDRAAAARGAPRFPDAGQHRARGAGRWWNPAAGHRRRCSSASSSAAWRRSTFPTAITPSACATPCSTICSASPPTTNGRARGCTVADGREVRLRARRGLRDLRQDRPPGCGADGRAYVVDYKYSGAQRREGKLNERTCCRRRSI